MHKTDFMPQCTKVKAHSKTRDSGAFAASRKIDLAKQVLATGHSDPRARLGSLMLAIRTNVGYHLAELESPLTSEPSLTTAHA